MHITLLKCKIHRATVTDANLSYEGSVTICPKLCQSAGLLPFEQVDIYNCNNGERFTTYVIVGNTNGEICINGAAARLCVAGDLVIIASYASMSAAEARHHQPTLVFVDANNQAADSKTLKEEIAA